MKRVSICSSGSRKPTCGPATTTRSVPAGTWLWPRVLQVSTAKLSLADQVLRLRQAVRRHVVGRRFAVSGGEQDLRLLVLHHLEDGAGEHLLALELADLRLLTHLHARVVVLGEVGLLDHAPLSFTRGKHHVVGALDVVLLEQRARLDRIALGVERPHLDAARRRLVA